MILKYICHIFSTAVGLYQRPYDKIWDDKLKWYLDGGEVKLEFNSYSTKYLTTTIAKDGKHIKVWVGNKYYSYGYLYQGGMEEFRPSIKTMILLDKRCSDYISVLEADRNRTQLEEYDKL